MVLTIGGFHMHEFKTLSGRLIEARRYLTRAARLRDHDPARERWELWLTTADGQEEKHVVASRLMPARSGHAVTLILLGDEPVGMFNLDAGYRVNFARADPTLLLRPVDVALGTRFDRGVGVHRPGHLRACRAFAGALHPGLGVGTTEEPLRAAAPGRPVAGSDAGGSRCQAVPTAQLKRWPAPHAAPVGQAVVAVRKVPTELRPHDHKSRVDVAGQRSCIWRRLRVNLVLRRLAAQVGRTLDRFRDDRETEALSFAERRVRSFDTEYIGFFIIGSRDQLSAICCIAASTAATHSFPAIGSSLPRATGSTAAQSPCRP
jgi:hypothetical protein